MSQLQKLLDEKWPIRETDKDDAFWKKSALRDAFKQGYTAGQTDAYAQFNEHMRQMEYMRTEESKK